MRKLIIPALLLLFSAALSAQETPAPWCGTTELDPWFREYLKKRFDKSVVERSGDTSWLHVPITLHIIGTDNGGGYFALDQAIRVVCNMNNQYERAFIRFFLYPGDWVRYTNKTAWYDHQYNEGAKMIDSLRIPGRLNCFIVDNPAGNCGYSWRDAIVMGKGCSGPNNITWAHEAGHHLSLPHPFRGWEGFKWDYKNPAPEEIDGDLVERTDTSNCYFAGDYFCDTRPDYLNYRWDCNANKESGVLQHDPDGVPFRSDATLIMGYANDVCSSRFTPEQIAAMRENLYDSNHSIYLETTPNPVEIPDDAIVNLVSPIDSQYVQYNSIELKWDPVPGATIYTVEVGLTSTFVPKLFQETVRNATSLKITKAILNNKALPWRVRAYNEWDLCQPNSSPQIGIFRTKNFTSTNDINNSLTVELAPNPVTPGAPAVLLVSSSDKMNVQLQIIDATGRVCFSEEQYISFGENVLPLKTESLQAGIYSVVLQNEKGVMVKRLAVQK